MFSSSVWSPMADVVAEYCPDAVTKYIAGGHNEKKLSLTSNMRNHLYYLGWGIEFMRDKQMINRFRYTSPDGKVYLSLRQICQNLQSHFPSPLSSSSLASSRPAGDTRSPKKLSLVQQATEPKLKNKPNDTAFRAVQRATAPRSVPQPHVVFETEYCPQAIIDWYNCKSSNQKESGNSKIAELSIKVKKHLSAMGWVFWYANKAGKRELRYGSPSGKVYYSLKTACKSCIDNGSVTESVASNSSSVSKNVVDVEGGSCSPATLSIVTTEEDTATQITGTKRKIGSSFVDRASTQAKGKPYDIADAISVNEVGLGLSNPDDRKVKVSRLSKGKVIADMKRLRDLKSYPRRRAEEVVRQAGKESGPTKRNPRTVLSFLIENNIVAPETKVHYGERGKKGRLRSDGIKCDCCLKIYTLSGFEAHSRSTKHRPAANIFLEDGRSLMDCQLQAMNCTEVKSFQTLAHRKGESQQDGNDDICSICYNGGELILCDICPSSFHRTCLGLNELSEGDWFCPSCLCGICKQRNFRRDSTRDIIAETNDKFLCCDQCERNFHIGCLKRKGHPHLEKDDHDLNKKWFCSVKCEKIFQGLQSLIGKAIPVGADNLTMTLLKSAESDKLQTDGSKSADLEASIQNTSKLHLALDVMHECFEPTEDPNTGQDLVENVFFNKSSKLRRSNFRGFHTLVLQHNDELISVANVRVYGEKVAEVPLVATRFQSRRQGMCRILMNGIEKLLANLGVERMTLPAVPEVLQTWTTSFGFKVMLESERTQFLEYTFLDFQDTITCQKLLSSSSYG